MCIKALTVFVLSRREFSHWKVNSLVTEKRDFFKAPLPLAPEFLRNLRLLGRRPSLQQIHENLIKKYGTHFLVSATLGGKPIFNEIYAKGEFEKVLTRDLGTIFCKTCIWVVLINIMIRGQNTCECKRERVYV